METCIICNKKMKYNLCGNKNHSYNFTKNKGNIYIHNLGFKHSVKDKIILEIIGDRYFPENTNENTQYSFCVIKGIHALDFDLSHENEIIFETLFNYKVYNNSYKDIKLEMIKYYDTYKKNYMFI